MPVAGQTNERTCQEKRDEKYAGERLMKMDVEGRRRKGRSKRRWMDSVNVDVRGKGLSGRRGKPGCLDTICQILYIDRT